MANRRFSPSGLGRVLGLVLVVLLFWGITTPSVLKPALGFDKISFFASPPAFSPSGVKPPSSSSSSPAFHNEWYLWVVEPWDSSGTLSGNPIANSSSPLLGHASCILRTYATPSCIGVECMSWGGQAELAVVHEGGLANRSSAPSKLFHKPSFSASSHLLPRPVQLQPSRESPLSPPGATLPLVPNTTLPSLAALYDPIGPSFKFQAHGSAGETSLSYPSLGRALRGQVLVWSGNPVWHPSPSDEVVHLPDTPQHSPIPVRGPGSRTSASSHIGLAAVGISLPQLAPNASVPSPTLTFEFFNQYLATPFAFTPASPHSSGDPSLKTGSGHQC